MTRGSSKCRPQDLPILELLEKGHREAAMRCCMCRFPPNPRVLKEIHLKANIEWNMEFIRQLLGCPLRSEQQKHPALLSIQHLKEFEAPAWTTTNMLTVDEDSDDSNKGRRKGCPQTSSIKSAHNSDEVSIPERFHMLQF